MIEAFAVQERKVFGVGLEILILRNGFRMVVDMVGFPGGKVKVVGDAVEDPPHVRHLGKACLLAVRELFRDRHFGKGKGTDTLMESVVVVGRDHKTGVEKLFSKGAGGFQ